MLETRQLIIDRCDQTDILDILDISVEELVDILWYKISDNMNKFEDVLDIDLGNEDNEFRE
jgi:hypothetical protein|tara:strand:+ start:1663 stop:1845 length:183 start_codon:yes stop_codon:yes gene_type:complete